MASDNKSRFGTESYTENPGVASSEQYGEKRLDLRYFFPQLGALQVPLFTESAELYRFLELEGEINRLKRIPHLGVISRLIESARHSKWEYVFLTMYVVHLAKTTNQRIGLSRGVFLGPGDLSISSGEELLKLWALLLNLGHLYGTFVAERSMIVALRTDKRLYKNFVDAFPDNKVKDYARTIIDSEDIYHFHHALAFFSLYHNLKKITPDLQAKWVEALKFYCLGEKSDQARTLKQSYQALRRVAYLILDMNYVPVPINLNSYVLFSKLDMYAHHIVQRSDQPIVRALDQLDFFVQDEVYLSPDVMRFAQAVNSVWANDFKRQIESRGGGPIKALRSVIIEQRNQTFKTRGLEKKLQHFARLPYPYHFELKPVKSCITEEDEWNLKLAGTGGKVSIWPTPDEKRKIVDIFVDPRNVKREAFLSNLLSEILNIQKGEFPRQSLLFGKLYRNLLLGILNQFVAENVRFSLKRENPFESRYGMLLARSRRRAIKGIENIVALQEFQILEPHRKDEIIKIKTSLEFQSRSRKPNGVFLVCLSEVLFRDDRMVQEGEIDGLYLSDTSRGFFLSIIEAKHIQSGRQAKADRELREKVKKLGKDLTQVDFRTFKGGATATFKL
jgi:hypothetical protein